MSGFPCRQQIPTYRVESVKMALLSLVDSGVGRCVPRKCYVHKSQYFSINEPFLFPSTYNALSSTLAFSCEFLLVLQDLVPQTKEIL